MYENAKMIPVETIPGLEVEGVNSSMIYVVHCKTFYKCYSVPPPSTTVKKKVQMCFSLLIISKINVF
jgi:hypothetical protein